MADAASSAISSFNPTLLLPDVAAQQEQLQQQMAYVQALRQQGMQEPSPVTATPGGLVVPTWATSLSNLGLSAMAGQLQRGIPEEISKLSQAYQTGMGRLGGELYPRTAPTVDQSAQVVQPSAGGQVLTQTLSPAQQVGTTGADYSALPQAVAAVQPQTAAPTAGVSPPPSAALPGSSQEQRIADYARRLFTMGRIEDANKVWSEYLAKGTISAEAQARLEMDERHWGGLSAEAQAKLAQEQQHWTGLSAADQARLAQERALFLGKGEILQTPGGVSVVRPNVISGAPPVQMPAPAPVSAGGVPTQPPKISGPDVSGVQPSVSPAADQAALEIEIARAATPQQRTVLLREWALRYGPNATPAPSPPSSAVSATPVVGPEGKPIQTEQRMTQENQLRNQFVDVSKPQREQLHQTEMISALSPDKPLTGVESQALIDLFNRTINPNSVVRQTAYGQTLASAGVFDRLGNIWNQITTGTKLTSKQIEDIRTVAKAYHDYSLENLNRFADSYRDIATRRGLEPKNVVLDSDFQPLKPEATPGVAPAAPAAPAGPRTKTIGGKTYMQLPDGRWQEQ